MRRRSVIGQLLGIRNLTPVAHQTPAGSLLTTMPSSATSGLHAMSATGTVFSIVNGLAESTSMSEWTLYRKATSGRKEDRIPLSSGQHPALDIWERPNSHMTQMEFIHAFMQHLELVGETDWLVRYDSVMGKMPLDMWPIRPDRVRPIEDPDAFIKGWRYTAPSGQQLDLDVREILPLKLPNPTDPYRGMGPVQSVMFDIDSSRYGAEWNSKFFVNGAVPGGVIEYPDRLTDPEFEELRDRWNSGHRGVDNAHRVAILERGKFVPTAFNMRDMQFAELRNVSTEVIRQAWRYPVAMMGTSQDVNRAAAEAAMFMHAEWMIVPRLCRIRGMLNTRFLPLWGPDQATRYEFDFKSPTVENREVEITDRESKVRSYRELVDSGVDPDTAAVTVGLPPLKRIEVASPAPSMARAELVVAPPHMLPILNAAEDDLAYAEYQAALDQVVKEWDTVSADQRSEVATQVQEAVDSGDLTALTTIAVSQAAGTAVLVAALVKLFQAFSRLTVADAAESGLDIDQVKPDSDEMNAIAEVTAQLLATATESSAINEALRITTPDSSGAEVAALVVAFLEGLSSAYLIQKLGAALWKAAAMGVAATVKASGLGVGFKSDETLDKNTCGPCRKINGTVYSSWEQVVSAGYATGGYHACEGRDRCRGRIKVVWK